MDNNIKNVFNNFERLKNNVSTENHVVRLILGYRSSDKLSLKRVPLTQPGQEMFADIAKTVLDKLTGSKPAKWGPTDAIREGELLVATADTVGDLPLVTRPQDKPLIEALIDAQSIMETNGKNLLKSSPSFYAFQVGSGDDSLTFLRRLNPQRGLQRKIFGILSDELSPTDGQVFAFDSFADLIITSKGILVLDQNTFHTIFRNQDDIKGMISGWVKKLGASIAMTNESQEVLLQKGLDNSRAAKRIESIVHRGHLKSLTNLDISTAMEKCGLKPAKYLTQTNRIIFSEDTTLELLKFLNEDIFRGALTNAPFEVDSKTKR
ncbi:Kiwa anti-phage protein KwaB-like domain-containing protein [Corynebacterium sp.]|uniref:Kiwa anti-phage protein KwaB-like domain-containing protein n=1 Tax=Corynebacterium sp. TaxID=1720 RepID=UPI0026DBE03B|nr:Kiwa anti-phage protein KwaB-like domain-containing protein [Corynebacterium sp.]MDO5031283.1 DUF4868 domain-containing protein [Corynebacterium sp.]